MYFQKISTLIFHEIFQEPGHVAVYGKMHNSKDILQLIMFQGTNFIL